MCNREPSKQLTQVVAVWSSARADSAKGKLRGRNVRLGAHTELKFNQAVDSLIYGGITHPALSFMWRSGPVDG